jgi:hypothetical protein
LRALSIWTLEGGIERRLGGKFHNGELHNSYLSKYYEDHKIKGVVDVARTRKSLEMHAEFSGKPKGETT